ncbi:MAG: glycoside hydrolase family 15 protein [Acidimicrobiales bacterium]
MGATPSPRIEGFAPITEYAVLGDGRTVALLARDGSIDWWPIPTIDAPPLCASILDPERGGRLCLAPEAAATVERCYLEGTNVVQTDYTTAEGSVRVTAALAVGAGGRLPWTELALRVEGLSGSVAMGWELVPGDRFRTASPWVRMVKGVPVIYVGDQMVAVITDGIGEVHATTHAVRGSFTATAGEPRGLLAVVATDDEPLLLPAPERVHVRLDRTVDRWCRWSAMLAPAGRWDEAVKRSALALKTILAEETGAIAAAATTSLPERIGGPKNWDYRYSWVRDSSFTLDALIGLDLHEEVQGAVSWLLDAIRRNDLRIFYRLDGSVADAEVDVDVPGYRCSRPVRSGNAASGQVQLGVYGDLFDTIHRYCAEGHVLDTGTSRLLAGLADRCCDQWRRQDSGIWELYDLRHYTISKMGCWVALDRAVRLADDRQLPTGHRDRWRAEADEIHAWVDENCWSDAKGSYTFYAGTDELDAATLLAARTGFDRGDRLAGTVAAVQAELARGPLLYRYTGVDAEEGAFVACSFWLVEALADLGRKEEAEALMDAMIGLANDVGLFSEQIDPATGELLGNTPQGLSHLSLINAARTLEGRP